MPLLNLYKGHNKYPTLGGYGIDFQNCVLYAPLWHARSKAASGGTFKSFDKNGHTITNTGATWTPPYGYTLDGLDDYISIPVGAWITGLTRITVIVVTSRSLDMAATLRMLVNKEETGGFSLGYYGSDNNKVTFYVNTGAWTSINWSTALNLNTHTYLAGTYDGTNINAYYNGTIDATPVAKSGDTGGGTQEVDIGAQSIAHGLNWAGSITEISIYNYALSTSQVMQHYLATKRRLPFCNLP